MKQLNKHISLILKQLRKERGWSLDKAALETGVSKAMLGQIERGESSPTIATLWKIASGFNTSFSSFLGEAPFASETMRHSQEVSAHHPDDKNFRVTPIFPYDDKTKSEIYIIKLLPQCEHLSPPHKNGVIEHVIVTEGTMEVLVNDKWQVIHENQGLRFNANQPHGYRNLTESLACIHNIIHY